MSDLHRVVSGDFCIGCGACTVASEGSISVAWDDYSKLRAIIKESPSLSEESLKDASCVCPFSGSSVNEDDLARELYPSLPVHDEIGRFSKAYAGWVAKDSFRHSGSSGGLTTWICCRLLEEGLVDAVVHVKPVTPVDHAGRLFEYGISTSFEEVKSGAKSRYYPVDMSGVLEQLRVSPYRRVVFLGLPCFIKAVRLLARQDSLFSVKIAYCVSLFCGHLKSAAFQELLAWQVGIKPGDVNAFDFRHKLIGRPASQYGFSATSRSTKEVVISPMSDVYGGDWGQGLFKYNACDYCDDVVGETADISIGDAWLPEYVNDHMGTNVVVVRHPDLVKILESGNANETIHLEPLDVDQVAQSQRSGLDHRREGLAYRLAVKHAAGEWIPPKRVKPSFEIPPKRKAIYDQRILLAHQSHLSFAEAKHKGDLGIFFRLMQPYIDDYRKLYPVPFHVKTLRKLKRGVKRLMALWKKL